MKEMENADTSGYWGGVLQQVEKNLRAHLSFNVYKYSCIVIAVQNCTLNNSDIFLLVFILLIRKYIMPPSRQNYFWALIQISCTSQF